MDGKKMAGVVALVIVIIALAVVTALAARFIIWMFSW